MKDWKKFYAVLSGEVQLITAQGLSRIGNFSRDVLEQLAKDGVLPSYWAGNKRGFKWEDIDQFNTDNNGYFFQYLSGEAYLKVSDTAQKLSTYPKKIYREIISGKLKAVHITADTIRIPESSLESYIEKTKNILNSKHDESECFNNKDTPTTEDCTICNNTDCTKYSGYNPKNYGL